MRGPSAGESSRGGKAFGWRWFFAWGVLGAAYTYALILLVLGLLAVPIVGLAALLLSSRSRLWPELLGLAQGPAATALMVAYIHRGRGTCPDGSTCGPNLDARPWLVIGAVLGLSSAVAYAALARRARIPWRATTSWAREGSTATAADARTSRKAVASVVVGIAGATAPLFLPLVAIVLGGTARRDISVNPGLGGGRLALAGIFLGLAVPLAAFGLFYAQVNREG